MATKHKKQNDKLLNLPTVKREKGESLKEYYKRRWRLRGRYQRRLKTKADTICQICGILLRSRFVKLKSRKYCDGCREKDSVKRYLRALYQSRWYQKKNGIEQDSLHLSEDI